MGLPSRAMTTMTGQCPPKHLMPLLPSQASFWLFTDFLLSSAMGLPYALAYTSFWEIHNEETEAEQVNCPTAGSTASPLEGLLPARSQLEGEATERASPCQQPTWLVLGVNRPSPRSTLNNSTRGAAAAAWRHLRCQHPIRAPGHGPAFGSISDGLGMFNLQLARPSWSCASALSAP